MTQTTPIRFETAFEVYEVVRQVKCGGSGIVFEVKNTAGGRLFLAMLERALQEKGGTYVFADTDSMAIVATRRGGPVPCVGPNRQGMTHAVSWKEVKTIASRFDLLNPYERSAVPSILKIEDVNFEKHSQREIQCYAISAKRYTFLTRATARGVQIIEPSEHGLGHLFVPASKGGKGTDTSNWVPESWRYLIGRVLGLRYRKPHHFRIPAMMRFSITTPDVLQILQRRQIETSISYRERIKPFNFILSPILNRQVFGQSETNETIRLGYPLLVDTERFTLIAPFTTDFSRWYKMPWINVHDGRWFYLAPLAQKQSFEASPYTLDDVIGVAFPPQRVIPPLESTQPSRARRLTPAEGGVLSLCSYNTPQIV